MDRKPQTEQELRDEIEYHAKEILTYHYGHRIITMREHINKIAQYHNEIFKLQIAQVVREIKDRYDDAETTEEEKALTDALAIILKNVK